MSTSQYIQYPDFTSQAVPTVANEASLPVAGAYDGQIYLTLDTDSLFAWNLASGMWVLLNSSSTITGTGANGKVTVWTGASSIGVSSASGVASLLSGALNTTADGTADQIFGMNHAANGYEYKSIVGTSSQVTVTHAANLITLSLPQNIATGSSPTFAGLTLSGLSDGVVHSVSGVLSGSAVVNADVSASAAIAFSKLAALNSGNILVGNVSNVAVSVAMSGDVTISNAGVTAIGATKVTNAMLAGSIAASKLVGTDIATVGTITAGTWNATKIGAAYGGTNADSSASTGLAKVSSGTWSFATLVNADISATAAIDFTKLQGLTSAHILVGNSSNVATDVAVSGDVTLANTGAFTIGAAKVTAAKMSSGAATSGFVATADGAGGVSYLSNVPGPLTSAHIFVGNGSNVATSVAVSGDLTLANTGAFTIAAAAVTSSKLAGNLALTGSLTSNGEKVACGASFTNNIKIYSGKITGSTGAAVFGTGFTPTRDSTGTYSISFDAGTGNQPVITVTTINTGAVKIASISALSTTPAVQITIRDTGSNVTDSDFEFIAICYE